MNLELLQLEFSENYRSEPRLFRAPGRINLIGEHTDYNDGFVLPAAIEQSVFIAAAARQDRTVRVRSRSFDGEFLVDLNDRDQKPLDGWARYVQGVAMILEREGFAIKGADLLIDSTIPVGAGLSSSAALEVASGFALSRLSGIEIDGRKLAKIGQKAEHEFAGVRSGIMDQFASVFGREKSAIFLDCRSLECEEVPVDAHILICNTMTKHDLAEGEYNKRRAECEAAARHFGVAALRDISIAEFEARAHELPDVIMRRARHIITDNGRVGAAVDALRSGDLLTLARLFDISHISLRDDFEISCAELDHMVDAASEQPEVLGARMTGGGFGGCVIALLNQPADEPLIGRIKSSYKRRTGIDAEIYQTRISDGVHEVEAAAK